MVRLFSGLLLLSSCIQSAQALRFYTQEQYQAARERAVQEARNGHLKAALTSQERLLKLEPDNQTYLADYINTLVKTDVAILFRTHNLKYF